jgi:uncharacterized protein (UPF0216 family)
VRQIEAKLRVMSSDMFSESSLQKLLSLMNGHIPTTRHSLARLLDDPDPNYRSRDGKTYRMNKEEIKAIAALLDPWELGRLKLPIVLMSDTGFEQSVWKTNGTVETKVVSKIIGREPEKEDMVLVYYPHLVQLRGRLPTTVTVMYAP